MLGLIVGLLKIVVLGLIPYICFGLLFTPRG